MQSSISTVSPLRQRMVEDMRMRKLAPKTQTAYIRAVRKFAKFLGHSPDTATDEDLRRFQLDMVDKGTSPITLNATIVGLNFLFAVTLGHPGSSAGHGQDVVGARTAEVARGFEQGRSDPATWLRIPHQAPDGTLTGLWHRTASRRSGRT